MLQLGQFFKNHVFKWKWAGSIWTFGGVMLSLPEVPSVLSYTPFLIATAITLGCWFNSDFLKQRKPRWNSKKKTRQQYQSWKWGVCCLIVLGFLASFAGTHFIAERRSQRLQQQATQKSPSEPIEPPKPEPARPTIAMAVYSGDQHKPGGKVYGIPWRSDLMDMRITISNNSGVDYENFSMSVEGMAMEKEVKGVSLGFYEIAQMSGPGECRTQRISNLFGVTIAPREGEPLGRPIDGTNLETTVRNVRADCPRFSNGIILVFVVAVTNLREVPSPKIKPAAALIGLRYKANGKEFSEPYFVDIRDMASARAKRTEEELTRLRSRIRPGKASAVSETFSIIERRRP